MTTEEARLRDVLWKVLHDHQRKEYFHGTKCACGVEVINSSMITANRDAWHREHVACILGEAVAERVAQAKAEAWDEGYGACVAKNRLVGRVGTASNPYRPCEDRYCTDRPDHEACSSGYPCMVTKASTIRPAAPSEGGES